MTVATGLLPALGCTEPPSKSPALSRVDPRRLCLVGLVGLAVLWGVFLRISYLIDHPMRYDEAYNYLHFASRSPAFIATHYLPNNHVLHTLMVKVSTVLFGTSPAALRLPALTGGLLLIPATAWLAWTISRNTIAAAAAAVAASLSSALVEYSSNARGYSWLALFSAVSTIMTIQIALRGERRHILGWTVAAALGMYTAPIMAYPLFGQLAALCAVGRFSRDRSRDRQAFYRRIALGAGLAAIGTIGLYAPILLVEGTSGFRRGTQMAYEIHGAAVGSTWGMLSSACGLLTRHAPSFWVIALGLGVAAFAFVSIRRREVPGFIALATVTVSALLVIGLGTPLPARAWLFALPILLACAAAGCVDLAHVFDRFTVAASTMPRTVGAAAHGAFPSVFQAEGPVVMALPRAGCLWVAVSAAMLLFSPGWELLRRPRLVAEPGGLVEVLEAVECCRRFAPQPCAIVSRYTPATAYYLSQSGVPGLVSPEADDVRRVFIVEDRLRTLAELWNEQVPGYSTYRAPRVHSSLRDGVLHVAERVDRLDEFGG